jgi:N-acyl-D-amino-acid deacylase
MLLEHSGGWTIEKGDRQINYLRLAADVFGEPRPATAEAIIRYTMGEPLDFTPGTRTVYSNFGYNILGRIIEKVSGKSYEQYVNEDILHPIGVTNMKIARTREIYRLPNEVKYYGNPNYEPLWSVLDEEQKQVAFPYGADYYIEVMDAHGGWLSTAESLIRFMNAVDIKTKGKHILNEETYKLMVGSPIVPPPAGATDYHVKGWNYNSTDGSLSHAGALWGVSSYLYHYASTGVTIAVIFNYLPMEKLNDFFGELNRETFPNSINAVTKWPEGDMFVK